MKSNVNMVKNGRSHPKKEGSPIHLPEKSGRVVDTQWFRGMFADRKTNARQVAMALGKDSSMMTNLLQGKRELSAEEAARIAGMLGVPVDEVIRHAGIDVPRPLKGLVHVTGHVDMEGRIHRGRTLGPSVVEGPTGADDTWSAVRSQTGGIYDGWLYFYRPIDGVSLEAIGRLCVVTMADGAEFLAWVRRGYEIGVYNVGPWLGNAPEKSVRVISAAPIGWARG